MASSLSLLFLGTGDAFNTDGRGSAALLLRPPGRGSLLVDVGPTVSVSFERAGVSSDEIDSVFITHLHGDHVAGWPFLLLRMLFLEQRSRALRVFGPGDIERTLGGLADLAYGDLLSTGALPFALAIRELDVKSAKIDCGGDIVCETIPMDHHPSSLGYVFRLEGASIGVSGDTAWCPGIEDLARSSDVLVLECSTLVPEGAKHVSLAELRAHADVLDGCRTFLVHTRDAVAAELERRPIPGVSVATDGMTVEM